MDKITHEVRIEQWKEIVRKCQARPEGQTAKAWLADHSISDKQYYYWLRQIRREAYEEIKNESLPATSGTAGITFAEVPLAETSFAQSSIQEFSPDAVIKAGHVTIALSNSISSDLLGYILKAVQHAC